MRAHSNTKYCDVRHQRVYRLAPPLRVECTESVLVNRETAAAKCLAPCHNKTRNLNLGGSHLITLSNDSCLYSKMECSCLNNAARNVP